MYPSQLEFLQHIAHECRYLLKESSENSFEQFMQNERLVKAISRSLEIIGEACNKIHPDIKAAYPSISWREISDLRNRIIHHYFGIDYDIVWDIVITDIPVLLTSIEKIIHDLQSKD